MNQFCMELRYGNVSAHRLNSMFSFSISSMAKSKLNNEKIKYYSCTAWALTEIISHFVIRMEHIFTSLKSILLAQSTDFPCAETVHTYTQNNLVVLNEAEGKWMDERAELRRLHLCRTKRRCFGWIHSSAAVRSIIRTRTFNRLNWCRQSFSWSSSIQCVTEEIIENNFHSQFSFSIQVTKCECSEWKKNFFFCIFSAFLFLNGRNNQRHWVHSKCFIIEKSQ